MNRLWLALSETMTGPWSLTCMTDEPDGIRDEIRVLPCPSKYATLGGCYRRLWMFSEEGKQLGERLVQIDLDCMVLGDLRSLFDTEDDFVAWRSYRHYCGSLMMLRAGAHPEVWTTFDPVESPQITRRLGLGGSDQAWIEHVLGPGCPVWTDRDHGVLSYRRHVRQNMRCRVHPPQGCRAIFFHGPFDPSMPSVQSGRPWIRDYWSRAA